MPIGVIVSRAEKKLQLITMSLKSKTICGSNSSSVRTENFPIPVMDYQKKSQIIFAENVRLN